MPASAVFLDRDGTINVRPPEHDYVRDPRGFVWLPGALAGLSALGRAGLVLVVVSNQRGVARGLVPYATLTAIEARIQSALRPYGCRVEAFRYCLHDVADDCACRKPKPGMLISAARELHIDLQRSWMIGDTEEDMEAGRAAGCRTIRITPAAAPGSAPDLAAAAAIVLSSREGVAATVHTEGEA